MNLIKKVRRQPEETRRLIAGSLTAVIMFFIGWAWVWNLKSTVSFDITPETITKKNGGDLLSPFSTFKENLKILRDLPKTLKSGEEPKFIIPEPETIPEEAKAPASYFAGVKESLVSSFSSLGGFLNKAWRWAYDPIK